jgi:hypothetical protein
MQDSGGRLNSRQTQDCVWRRSETGWAYTGSVAEATVAIGSCVEYPRGVIFV